MLSENWFEFASVGSAWNRWIWSQFYGDSYRAPDWRLQAWIMLQRLFSLNYFYSFYISLLVLAIYSLETWLYGYILPKKQ